MVLESLGAKPQRGRQFILNQHPMWRAVSQRNRMVSDLGRERLIQRHHEIAGRRKRDMAVVGKSSVGLGGYELERRLQRLRPGDFLSQRSSRPTRRSINATEFRF